MDIFLLYNVYGGYMRLDNKGFTLVEVIAVVAIITILSVVVVPSVLNSINNGKQKSYEVLVGNIKIAGKELYEEIYSNVLTGDSSMLYKYSYNNADKKIIKSSDVITIDNNKITVNLQSLVSNGFLSGTGDGNKNKTIVNPKDDNSNIGDCEIIIEKVINSSTSKVSYNITSKSNDSKCPSSDDYKNGVS